jgi:hypothetical protein
MEAAAWSRMLSTVLFRVVLIIRSLMALMMDQAAKTIRDRPALKEKDRKRERERS